MKKYAQDPNLQADTENPDAMVRAEMIALVYQNTPTAILGTTVAVFITWVVFARLMPVHVLLLWTTAVMGALYIRYAHYSRFVQTQAVENEARRWEGLSTLAVGITGLCIGVGGVVIASNVPQFYQGVILLLILGIVVSAIPILGAVRKIYFTYTVGAALPVAVWCVQRWDLIYISTSALLGVFIWVAWVTSSKYSQSIESVIRARNELNEVNDARKILQDSYERLSREEQKVRAGEERFRKIFDDGLVGMAILSSDGSVQRVNHSFCRSLGYERRELIGRRFGALIHPDHWDEMKGVIESVTDGKLSSHKKECRFRHKNRSDVDGLAALNTVRDDAGELLGTLVQVQDVTEERGIRRKLTYQASHDALTGLVNRSEFQFNLDRVVRNAKSDGTHNVLCYLDLDHFKLVNDTFGHSAGDAALTQIAKMIQDCARSRDTIARLGGDEFGIIFENCTEAKAEAIISRIVCALNDTEFVLRHRTFSIGASAGLVNVTHESRDAGELMKQADLACNTAKDRGRGQVYLYPQQTDDPTLHSDIIRAVQWMDAYYDERLRLYAQQILPMNGSGQSSPWYEVLLRIVTDDGAIVSPHVLIPAMERYGQMASIDRWVIDTALREYQLSAGDDAVRLSINLSGTSVASENLSGYIGDKLAEYAVPPENVCFELTETSAVLNISEVLDLMNRLKQCGCMFALDDFGSGLSSFKYLKQLPFDYLKIDGSLVHEIVDDPANYAMIRAIQQLSGSLNLKSIAEWITTDEVAQVISSLGIDYGQGFFYNEPRPIERIWQG